MYVYIGMAGSTIELLIGAVVKITKMGETGIEMCWASEACNEIWFAVGMLESANVYQPIVFYHRNISHVTFKDSRG